MDDDKTVLELVTDVLHPRAEWEGMTPGDEEEEFDAIVDSITRCRDESRATQNLA